jgi:Rap1a immunity proteins
MNFGRITAALAILGAVGADIWETSAQKDTRTGTEMLPSCRAFLEGAEALKHATPEENLRAGFCAGYVIGMLTEETEACVPPIKGNDAVRTVIEYIEAHPDQLNEPFDDLVERALITIWPCKP